MKPKLSKFVVSILFSFLVIFSFEFQSKADTPTDLDQLLSQIAKYDWGQSREPLTQLSELIRTALDSPTELKKIEMGMLKLLKSDATLAGKQFICQELSIIGTEDAVPTLTPLLLDSATSDMARYALERISGEKVNEALRNAVAKTSGKIKVGIINTLGQRHDARSVNMLGKLVNDSDPTIASSSAAALGKIANEEAIQLLANARNKTTGTVKLTVLDAYLKCADQLVINNELQKASAIYEALFKPEESFAIRSAALRGIVKTAGDRAEAVILDVLKNEEPKIQAVAIGLVRELPESHDMTNIAAELPNLPISGKVQLLTAFADRGDPSVRETIMPVVKDDSVEVRMAALKAITRLGNETDIDLLIDAAVTGDEKEKEVAQESLSLLKGANVDQIILSRIPQARPEIQTVLIQAVSSRNITAAGETLLQTAKSQDKKVRAESFKALGEIGDPTYLPHVIDLLLNLTNESDRPRAENTVFAVARKIAERDHRGDVILERLATIKDINSKSSLLRILGKLGDRDALPILRKSLDDKKSTVKEAAILALSDWPMPAPLDDLLKVAQKSKNEVHQVLALRGYIGLIGLESERTDDETIKLYLTAMNLAKDINEKRMVLSGLSNVKTLSALETVAKYCTDPNLQWEAEVAVVKIADETKKSHPERTKEIITQLINTTQNENVKRDAQKIIDALNESTKK